jgi:hypothetical protein
VCCSAAFHILSFSSSMSVIYDITNVTPCKGIGLSKAEEFLMLSYRIFQKGA